MLLYVCTQLVSVVPHYKRIGMIAITARQSPDSGVILQIAETEGAGWEIGPKLYWPHNLCVPPNH
jgi:hypothetical protein